MTNGALTHSRTQLKFCCRKSVKQYITLISSARIICHDGGTVIHKDGVLIGARCSASIPSNITHELLLMCDELEELCPFLLRGIDVANVCTNFVVTGLKEDQNTKLKMTHSPKND